MGSEEIYFENYRLIARLGSGAFGYVYKAQHVILTSRIVAIKIMRPELTENEEAVLRFLKESQFLYELKHPYILPIIDAGISISNGVLYQVTEYASKGSLRTRLLRQPMHPLPLTEAITIISQVGQALEYAHDQNIIHRDLKPENILFNEKDAALVADFGIATVLNTSSIKHTNAVGTYQYMAPEEYQDLVCKESDQYALGCIAYELFTGHLPFQASHTASIIAKHLTEQPLPLRKFNPELPEHIENAILKALAKQRTHRHADISAFVTALITTPAGLRAETNKDWMAPFVDKAHEVHEVEFRKELTESEKVIEDDFYYSPVFDDNDESYRPYDLDYEPDNANHFEEELDYFSIDHQTHAQTFATPKQASNTIHPKTVITLNEKGLSFFQQEHLQEALVAFEQSLKVNPDQTSVWCYKGAVLRKLLRFEEALDAYKYALQFNPDFSPAYVGIGEVLLELDHYEEALKSYEQAIRLSAHNANAYYGKGNTLWYLKRNREALAAFDQCIKLDSKHALAYFSKGSMLKELGHYDEALASFEQAIHLGASEISYASLFQMGRSHVIAGRYREGLATFEVIIRHDPNNVNAYFEKGMTHSALKHYEAAAQAFKQFIDLDSENDKDRLFFEGASLHGLIQTLITPETRRLLEERIIFIGTPIDDNVANLVVSQLLYLQGEDATKDINLYINSPGGVIYSGLTIYDTMQWLKPDVSTVCVGIACGVAAILLAAGAKRKRFALPASEIRLVPVQGGAEGSKVDIEITAREILRLRCSLIDILVKHTGQSPERIIQDMDRILRLHAGDAVNYGIVDEVLSSS
jgi:ATP-dependent Clp endopeptidase proteolytic subunit ClpP